MRTRTLAVIAALALMMGLTACGGDDGAPAGGDEVAVDDRGVAPDAAMGPGLAVPEALESDATEPLLVRGYLVAVDGTVRLCEALAESFPPQCGGTSLEVVGADLDALELQEEGDVRWSDDEVALLGALDDAVLTVDETATG